jgi:hypothetical protein
MDLETVRKTKNQYRGELLRKRNVVATGVGYKVTAGQRTEELCVVVSVAKKVPTTELSAADLVPGKVDEVRTDVVETGVIRALQSPTDRWRPAPGGVSIGHINITAGTLGCLVKKSGEIFILSNNHVLANSNDAELGDPILQPGPYDGGKNPGDLIANLSEFVPIQFSEQPSPCPVAGGLASLLNGLAKAFGSYTRLRAVSIRAQDNLVDAAIARPLKNEDVRPDILEIGTIDGLAEGELGMGIQKSGRTTGLTTGEILQVDVTVSVQYGEGRVAQFTDQLMAGAMSQGGDSGSAVLDKNNNLVGLLFAGSDNSTIINRIENVFDALGLTL